MALDKFTKLHFINVLLLTIVVVEVKKIKDEIEGYAGQFGLGL